MGFLKTLQRINLVNLSPRERPGAAIAHLGAKLHGEYRLGGIARRAFSAQLGSDLTAPRLVIP